MNDPAWQAQLPELIRRCQRLWSLELGEKLEGGYLAEVRGCMGPGGEDLVLKISPPIANAADEAKALAHWDGRGAARLVDWDAEIGALLLERIRPGAYLLEHDRTPTRLPGSDERAVAAASVTLAAIQRVPAPPDGMFPSFENKLRWFLDFTAVEGEPGAVGTRMLPQFERCARALDTSAKRKTLAHGDFLGKNLLLANDGRYVAIDPLPYIGDPCADAGHFSAYHSPVATVASRARAIADRTDNDPDRAARWAAVWMIGEACETWREDSDDVQAWVQGDECLSLLASCSAP